MDDKIEQLKAVLPSIPEMAPGLYRETDTSDCGPCPICQDGKDRFVYKANEKKFWCRQCRPKGGDAIDLYRLIYNKTLTELFIEYKINGNKSKKPALPLQLGKKEDPPKKIYSRQDRWNNLLNNKNTDPILRLAKRRGISNETVLKAYNENKVRFTMHRLKDQEEISSVACKYCELDGDKKILAIQMLSADGDFYSDTEKKDKVFVYGSNNDSGCFFQVGEDIDQASIIIIFESVINAFSCAEVFPGACCLATGSSIYTKKVAVLRKYRDKGAQIICFFDNDKDGQKAVDKISIILGAKTKTVKWSEDVPARYDVNDLLKDGKQKEIINMVNSAELVEIDEAGTEEEADDLIDELNKKHAVIMVGGKIRILYETTDKSGRPNINFLSEYDFKTLYANRKIPNPLASQKGQPKHTPLATAWLGSSKRREYQDIIFDPKSSDDNFYNLFRGFAYQPAKGDWSLFKAHISENICSGIPSNLNWLIAWLARIVQDPGGEKPGTAVVLRGDRGTGKGIFVETFGKIFGHHFYQVTNSKQVTGRFNAHLKDCILLHMDEAWFAGDKSAEGVLKGLITSFEHMIELKGKDAFMVDNHVNCIVASNNDWVVPVGNKERRFFLMDVSNNHIQDYKYFKAIDDQMNKQGGIEAMLYDLLAVDVSRYNLRQAPKTKGLFDQLLQNLSSFEQFWYEKLSSSAEIGEFDIESDNENMIFKSKLYDEYIDFCKKINVKYIFTHAVFGKNLAKNCDFEVVQRLGSDQKRYNCYVFPKKNQCRNQFSKNVGMDIEWKPAIAIKAKNEIDKI